MRSIHPDYVEATVTCGCGNTFVTRSTRPKLTVEICSVCHPFYTGQQKIIDSAGMVERFQKRWGSQSAQQKAADHIERRTKGDAKIRAAERVEKVMKGEVKLADLDKHFPSPKKDLPPEPPLPRIAPPPAPNKDEASAPST
jgi:large subunit ribosomal protein L31